MAYNGSGTYIPPAGQPVATGTVIQSSTFNSLVTDIGNTLNNVLPRDGKATMSGQLKLIDGTSTSGSNQTVGINLMVDAGSPNFVITTPSRPANAW